MQRLFKQNSASTPQFQDHSFKSFTDGSETPEAGAAEQIDGDDTSADDEVMIPREQLV